MNRHDRRAEARANRDLRQVQQAPTGTIPTEMVPDFFKGVAWQLRGLEFKGLPNIGGHCIFHTLAAYQAVRASGVDCSIGIGSLVARIGPDERRDVVAFCGPRNMGVVMPNGHAGFHCWLRYGDWIVDYSLHDWKRTDAVECELMTFGTALEPPQWSIELPRWWLKHSNEVELAWRPSGTPELGQAWYGPFFGDQEQIVRRIRAAHEDVGAIIAQGLSAIFNDYCQRHGIAHHQHDDAVYPLKFRTMSIRPEADPTP